MGTLFKVAAALAAAVALAACSSSQTQSAASPSPSPGSLRNLTGFPLYSGANIVSARKFTQSVQVQNAQNSVFNAGNGTYDGSEVIAASDASFSDLSAWLAHVSNAPPSGYTPLETGNNPSERQQARQYGLDYAAFRHKDGANTHGVLVIVMDPQRVNERFGKVLGMIAKYRALPEAMRAPIDNAAKARIGMTITQATQPDSPIGAALSALSTFEHKDARGIVVIDAAKQ